MLIDNISTSRVLKVPVEYVKNNKVVLIYEDKEYIEMGSTKELNNNELQYLEFLYGKKVYQKILPKEEIDKRIFIYFGHEFKKDITNPYNKLFIKCWQTIRQKFNQKNYCL